MTASASLEPASPYPEVDWQRRALWVVVPLALVGLQLIFAGTQLPEHLDETFSDPLDRFASWAQQNRSSNWLFTVFFRPLTSLVSTGLETIEGTLLWVPWFVIPIAIFL